MHEYKKVQRKLQVFANVFGGPKRAAILLSFFLAIAINTLFLCVMGASPTYSPLVDTETISVKVEPAIVPLDQLASPKIISIDPTSAVTGSVVNIRIICENLPDAFQFSMIRDGIQIMAAAATRIDAGSVLCTFDLAGAQAGKYGIMNQGPDGTSATLEDCFSVEKEKGRGKDQAPQPGPVTQPTPVQSQPQAPQEPQGNEILPQPVTPPGDVIPDNMVIAPCPLPSGGVVDVIIQGGPFFAGLQGRLSNARAIVWTVECRFPSATRMECRFNLLGIPVGIYRFQILDYKQNIIHDLGNIEIN